MKRRTFLLSAAATLAAPAIRAQAAWPMGQPIRVIVPYPAGAANDAMGRLAAQRLQDKFGATVVVENRAGGSASIGTTAVLNAAPDGYTILASAFNHIIMNHAVKGVSFDPQADFETIGRTAARAAADGDVTEDAAEDRRRSDRRRQGRAERLDLRAAGARRADHISRPSTS
jgi:tripartite-type tricarboxylate transporter receptor subunit TctC